MAALKIPLSDMLFAFSENVGKSNGTRRVSPARMNGLKGGREQTACVPRSIRILKSLPQEGLGLATCGGRFVGYRL